MHLAIRKGRLGFARVDLTLEVHRSLEGIEAAAWNALDHGASPFLEWGFLRAAELSGSIGEEAGWLPFFLTLWGDANPDAGEGAGEGSRRVLVGAVAAFVKTHSYGEYIFDFQWANAAERVGLPYYPKLVIAAPVTPATGPRILLARELSNEARVAVSRALIEAVDELARETNCRSTHWLFCLQSELELLVEAGYAPRSSLQFHWHNRGYTDFDDFLGRMQSRKRKKFKKERRKVHAAIEGLRWIEGDALTPDIADTIDRFYRITTSQHWGRAYLEPGFFHELLRLMPERVRFVQVDRAGEAIAGALFLETPKALYGRYWGCTEEVEFLHFETAYYAGIERCIEREIPLFEAGAQGEHKLLRGFEPALTRSAHKIEHPGLDRGVREFCREESQAVAARIAALADYGPYKQTSEGD